jgi:uncharacterized protein
VAELLLSRGSSTQQPAVDVNARLTSGHVALHFATRNDDTAMVLVLLKHGAAVNVRANCGSTPLITAAISAGTQCVQLLLNAGAELTAQPSVLHLAVSNERPEVLQLLLEQGAAAALIDNVAKACDCCGKRTALMRCEQPAHLKLLLAAGADVHMTTDRGSTALHVAAAHKFAAPVLCLLIKAGVDLHAENFVARQQHK